MVVYSQSCCLSGPGCDPDNQCRVSSVQNVPEFDAGLLLSTAGSIVLIASLILILQEYKKEQKKQAMEKGF
ncbi:MAG: hypothetical protein V1743_01100 [Nanoarchaeota archaeon]